MQIRKWGQAFALRTTLKVNFNKRIFITDSRYRYSLKFLCLVLSCSHYFSSNYSLFVILIWCRRMLYWMNHRRRSCEGSDPREILLARVHHCLDPRKMSEARLWNTVNIRGRRGEVDWREGEGWKGREMDPRNFENRSTPMLKIAGSRRQGR